MFFKAQGNQTFWRDIRGFLPGYPGGAQKVREKKFVFNSRPLMLNSIKSGPPNIHQSFHFCKRRPKMHGQRIWVGGAATWARIEQI